MRASSLCLFIRSQENGSSSSWHRGQYFEFLSHTTQMSIHPSSASEVSEGQKQKAGREGFPAFLKEGLVLQE